MSDLPTDDSGWFELVLGNQPPLWQVYAEACGGDIVKEEGVQAAIIPASPNRSFFNSVFYRHAPGILSQLDMIARKYDEAGVRAWTVWVPEAQKGVAKELERAGHVLDAEPRAMGLELEDLQVPEPDPELEIRSESTPETMETVRQINETAYGYAPGDFPPIAPLPETDVYLASLDGETVGTVITWDRGADTEVMFVAVLPEARGRGVSGRLMAHALADQRDRGKQGSTLIATKLGLPVYEKLGYRDVGGLQMWERRQS